MEIEKSVIDRISTLKDLPSLPHILVKLMEACQDENGCLGDIAAILTNDPSLCAKVLRLVNSAYYGLGGKVESIDQAVAYLGTNAVKNIAICSSVYQVFNSRKGSNAFNLKIFWWHSLKCALLSRIFAKKMAYDSPDEAFVAGLLHDIGKLVLWVNFSDNYTELIKKYGNRADMLAAGESRLGATHSQIGGWLLDRWKFPVVCCGFSALPPRTVGENRKRPSAGTDCLHSEYTIRADSGPPGGWDKNCGTALRIFRRAGYGIFST